MNFFPSLYSTYERLPSMSRPRMHHSCGLAETDDKKEIVVAGGRFNDALALDTVDIFNLETRTWRAAGSLNQATKMYKSCPHNFCSLQASP